MYLDRLESVGVEFALLLNSRLTTEEFFEALSLDLSLTCESTRKVQVLMALQERAAAAGQQGSTIAILIDNAHKLGPEILDEIDLLSNYESRRGKLLQIVLAGQAALDSKLQGVDLYSLKQRIGVRARLAGLDVRETTAYIHARLLKAGAVDCSIFPESITREIWERTGGIPRLINAAGGALLEAASKLGLRTLTAELVHRIAGELDLRPRTNDWSG
jgi:general secretion pathway protein A